MAVVDLLGAPPDVAGAAAEARADAAAAPYSSSKARGREGERVVVHVQEGRGARLQ